MSRYEYKPTPTKQREPAMAPEERAKMVRRARSAYLDSDVILRDWEDRFPGWARSEALADIPPSLRRRGTQ